MVDGRWHPRAKTPQPAITACSGTQLLIQATRTTTLLARHKQARAAFETAVLVVPSGPGDPVRTRQRTAAITGRRIWNEHRSVYLASSSTGRTSSVRGAASVSARNEAQFSHSHSGSTFRPTAIQLWRHARQTSARNSVLSHPQSMTSDPQHGHRGAGCGSPRRRPARV
jgi:hypothetical protein